MSKVIELKSDADPVPKDEKDSAQSKIEQAIHGAMQKFIC